MTLPPTKRRFAIGILERGQYPRVVQEDPSASLCEELLSMMVRYPDAVILVIEITDTKVWLHTPEAVIEAAKGEH